LNRVDDIIVFHPLSQDNLRKIVDIQLKRLHPTLAENNVTLTLSDPVKEWLAQKGYDPVYGARPLKRLIQTEITSRLAKQLIIHNTDEPVEFEATLSGDGDRIEFAEVFSDAEAWAGYSRPLKLKYNKKSSGFSSPGFFSLATC